MNWQAVAKQQGQKRFINETPEQFQARVIKLHTARDNNRHCWRLDNSDRPKKRAQIRDNHRMF